MKPRSSHFARRLDEQTLDEARAIDGGNAQRLFARFGRTGASALAQRCDRSTLTISPG
jgi:hypothetical protein